MQWRVLKIGVDESNELCLHSSLASSTANYILHDRVKCHDQDIEPVAVHIKVYGQDTLDHTVEQVLILDQW